MTVSNLAAAPADGRDHLDLMESILDSSTEYAIIAVGLDGLILLWNEGAKRTYGYEADEVVGKVNVVVLAEVVPGTEDDWAVATRAARDEGKWDGMLRCARRSGEVFTTRAMVTPRRDEFGEISGFLMISSTSEETRLADELRTDLSYTRSLIESTVDPLMVSDPLGVIIDVNERMEALTGLGRAELVGTRFKDYVTDAGAAESAIKLAVQQGTVVNYELTVRHRDGRETVLSFNASTFRDARSRLRGVVASARDITEQQRVERNLRESEAYNRGLFEASVDGLLTVDAGGQILDVNGQMCRMAGLSREDLIGTPFVDHFADTDHAVAGVLKAFELGVVTDYELRLSTTDGRHLNVSLNASVFRDPLGEVGGIFVSARDTTEQAHLQTQLLDERAYNRGLIEASLDGLVTVDAMLTVTDVNNTMCVMSGFSRQELIGSSFPDHFSDPSRAAAGVRQTLDQGEITNYELVLRSKEGEQRLVSFNAAIFKDEHGEVRGICAAARDITDQAELRRRLAEEQTYNRSLFEAAMDGLVTVDEAMMVTDVNETMCRMVGRQRVELIGSAFPTYFTEPERASAGVRLTIADGSTRDYVLTLLGADGVTVPVSFSAAVFRNSAGEPVGILASTRDIAGQQELELQLRDSQFYTRSLIDSNVDALMTTDPLGLVTDVNQQMELLTGCGRDELLGTMFKEHFTEPQRAEDAIRQTLTTGNVNNYELTVLGRDGTETPVSYNAATLLDRRGQLQGVFAAARDATETKTLEVKLRDQAGYLRGQIESSVDGLLAVDPEGYISDANGQMCRMSGYQRAELLGTPFAKYFTDPARATAGIEETLATGTVTEYGLTMVSRTRRMLQVSLNASVYTGTTGSVIGVFASARDITDRVRLENKLRDQQTYLRGLIESSVDGLLMIDPDGYITDVNEKMCQMSGFSRAELIGSPFRQYFADQVSADIGVKRTFAMGAVTNYELVLLTKNKHKSTVSCNASVYRSADGKVEGIFASARDISEQALLRQQLDEQQIYTRSLIEASADALFVIAPDGVITDVNEEATRLTGYSRHHLIDSTFSGYFTESDLARDGVEKTLAEERVRGYELTLLTRHGRQVTVSFNAGVFHDTTGTPLGVLTAARNINTQKELEQRLRDLQFYTRSLFESNIDALMTTDSLGLLTDVNQQMETLTGRARDELIGSPFKRFFTDPDLAEEGIRAVLKEEKITDYELTASHADGTEKVVSYNATTLYDQQGHLQGVFAAVRDITERKVFERKLWENLELEKASQAKNNFLTSMSHELRTPLNAIIGFTGTMIMRLPGALNDEQERHLRIVQDNGKHLLSIINDLLDMAKIESGNVTINREPTDCGELVSEVVESLRPLAEVRSITLATELPDQEVTVLTDKRALSQILINLVNNAIKFTDKGGVRVRLEAGSAGRNHQVMIIDTGVGIEVADQERIFESFQRTDSSVRLGKEGTGLGLHISSKLARLIDASINVSSQPGEGSTFTVTIGG
jgi:PAS domain S-box-containing protein